MIRPLHDRVLVKRVAAEERSLGGIIIPETAKEKPSQGIILAVGPGRRIDSGELIPPAVEVGETVLFAKFAGTELVFEGEDCLILSEGEIIGVVPSQD